MTMQNALLTIPICNCYKKNNNQGVHCAHPENTHTPVSYTHLTLPTNREV